MEPDDPRVNELVGDAVARIAYNIDRLAEERGWSLRKVSRQTGINTQSIFNIRNGNANPTMKTLVMLADGLGVDVTELLRAEKAYLGSKPDTSDEAEG